MFGPIRRIFGSEPETRSGEIDLGALYASVSGFGASGYSWSRSPALLVSSLSLPDAAGDSTGVLLTESRRLGRASPLLIAYRGVIETGLLTGEPEAPEYADSVPERVAEAMQGVWMDHHDCDRERDLLDRLVLDGEFLILDDGTVVFADGFAPVTAGPDWNKRVTGYRIGRASYPRRTGLRYVGNRPMGAARALPWVASALPSAAGLLNARTGAGHAIGTMAKLAAVIANASPDRQTASLGGRSGVVDQSGDGDTPRQPITSVGVGAVPFMKPGEAVSRVEAGPDKQAMDYESQLEMDVAACLNMPLSELKSDYSSGSFSNLRMGWCDAERELRRKRTWWHRHYRMPLYAALLADAFAEGRLPRMSQAVMAALKRPVWPGPKRQPPQPEKEAQSVAMLVDKGIITPADAAAQLER